VEGFDPDTQQALQAWYAQEREAERVAEFTSKHREELSDPVLAGTVQRLIHEANAKGQRKDQEEALAEAKSLLDSRLKPQVNEAKREGVSEGQELAQKKQQAAAVGDTGTKSPVKGDNELSATELAAKYGIPRVN